MTSAGSNFASTSSSPLVGPSNQDIDERQPLLAGPGAAGNTEARKKKSKKPFYRARPLWLVPFALVSAVVRGMTLAPRVEVFTQLSCHRVYRLHHNHTEIALASPFLGTPATRPIFHLSSHVAEAEPVFHPNFAGGIFDDDNDNTDPGDSSGDPRNIPTHRCVEDPEVQSGAAKLQMIMSTTVGVLSALTTGWWGCFGERHGRTRVLAISTFGLFLTDLMFILVSTPTSSLSKHGHKFLLVAPVIEGALGGWSTLQAAASAYISDCTSSGSRAQIFSRFSGVTFLGIFFGPTIGAYLISHSEGTGVGGTKNVTAVFWVAVCCSFLNFLAVAFVFPESLAKEKREAAIKVYESGKKGKAPVRGENGNAEAGSVTEASNFLVNLFAPLAVFLPVRVRDPVKLNRYRRDWSLTLLAVAFFCYLLCVGLYQLKYLYAEHVYGWGAEELSWYISFMGGMRAVALLLVLPYFISVFKPKAAVDSTSSQKGKGKPATGPAPPLTEDGKKPKPTRQQLGREISFDLMLTRCSFLMDMLSNVLIVVSPSPTFRHTSIGMLTERAPGTSFARSQALFVLASGMSSFGNGALPALQSLTLCILQAREMSKSTEREVRGDRSETSEGEGEMSAETGSKGGSGNVGGLFGAFAFLQSIGSMILGPIMFGMVYSSTVAFMPKAIFMVATATLFVSFLMMLLVRNPVQEQAGPAMAKKGKKKRGAVERGRSRVSKDLRGGAAGFGDPTETA